MRLSNAQKRGLDGRARILRHIAKTGHTFSGQVIWTEQEKIILKKYFPDRSRISVLLPGRTLCAISKKAQKLGLVRSLRIWTEDEARQLRTPYITGMPIGQIELLFTGKNRRQIWSKAYGLGYRRPRKAPCLTGFPLVDEIRKRAFELNLRMKDLDLMLGLKRYFVSPRYVNLRAVQRAMVELEGQPIVRWLDKTSG